MKAKKKWAEMNTNIILIPTGPEFFGVIGSHFRDILCVQNLTNIASKVVLFSIQSASAWESCSHFLYLFYIQCVLILNTNFEFLLLSHKLSIDKNKSSERMKTE